MLWEEDLEDLAGSAFVISSPKRAELLVFSARARRRPQEEGPDARLRPSSVMVQPMVPNARRPPFHAEEDDVAREGVTGRALCREDAVPGMSCGPARGDRERARGGLPASLNAAARARGAEGRRSCVAGPDIACI